jgi:hypothetical protein
MKKQLNLDGRIFEGQQLWVCRQYLYQGSTAIAVVSLGGIQPNTLNTGTTADEIRSSQISEQEARSRAAPRFVDCQSSTTDFTITLHPRASGG